VSGVCGFSHSLVSLTSAFGSSFLESVSIGSFLVFSSALTGGCGLAGLGCFSTSFFFLFSCAKILEACDEVV
jgi:hypothetical protein